MPAVVVRPFQASWPDLLLALVQKNIKVRYKQSLLGPLWLLLQPVLLTALFVVIQLATGMRTSGMPFVVFVFAAMIPWSFFANAVVFSASSIVDNAPVIKKLACPRILFPLASVLASLVDLAASYAVFGLLMLWYGIAPSWYLCLLPVVTGVLLALACGVSFLAAAISAYRRDLIIAMPFLMQFWLLASPVMYGVDAVPASWRMVVLLNPMAGIIEAHRTLLVRGALPDVGPLAASCLGALLLLAGGYLFFQRLEKRFADVV